MPLVLLGPLDVLVHLSLRFEPISTALIRAGERSLPGVGRHVPLRDPGLCKCCQAARVGAAGTLLRFAPRVPLGLAVGVAVDKVLLRGQAFHFQLFSNSEEGVQVRVRKTLSARQQC